MKDKKWKKKIKFKYTQSVDISSEKAQDNLNRAYDLLFDSVLLSMQQEENDRMNLVIRIINLLDKITVDKLR